MRDISRREFISAAAGLGAAFLVGCGKGPASKAATLEHRTSKIDSKVLSVASGLDPAKNTRAAVEALGGMSKVVRKGDFVVIKPNIAWNRAPEMAATTNPQVVAELIRMCKEVGAGRVLIVDHLIDRPAEAVLGMTGIGPAASKAGAETAFAPNESDYRSVEIPKGKAIQSDTCIREILSADVFINVPIAKAHSSTGLTLGMKNLMGCIWDRQAWHQNSLDQCIADYSSAIKPDLIVLDATRILLTNGPKGPGQTKDVKKVIAGIDPVAVDAYGATLFGKKPTDIGHIRLAHELGIGEIDLTKMTVKNA